MGNLQRRQSVDDGTGHGASGHAGSALDLPAGRDARSDRGGSERLGRFSPAAAAAQMTASHPPQAGTRALLVAGRSDHAELEGLLRGMGYHPVLVSSADQMAALRDPISLCLIDLRQNGEALRSERTVRAQYPQSVVISVAD